MNDSLSNRNASATSFGFLFQLNVAIYFMFVYLQNIKSIRVEGQKEDIEISLVNDKKYMIQAKSIAKDLYDSSNNSSKLSKALLSLSEADSSEVENLFYVSNLLNPLNSTTPEFKTAYNVVTLKYSELSSVSKKKIDRQLQNNGLTNFDTNKLIIMRIPFFGEVNSECYKYIFEEAKNTLTMMSDTLGNKYKEIVPYCESKLLQNASNSDMNVKISKKEFCNWIILTEIETMDLSNDNIDIGIDELDYYEAYQQYQRFISDRVDNYENYSKVYSLFYKANMERKISINEFVKQNKIELYNYFFDGELSGENEISDNNKFDVYISQIISYAILKKKSIINRIKERANI